MHNVPPMGAPTTQGRGGGRRYSRSRKKKKKRREKKSLAVFTSVTKSYLIGPASFYAGTAEEGRLRGKIYTRCYGKRSERKYSEEKRRRRLSFLLAVFFFFFASGLRDARCTRARVRARELGWEEERTKRGSVAALFFSASCEGRKLGKITRRANALSPPPPTLRPLGTGSR